MERRSIGWVKQLGQVLGLTAAATALAVLVATMEPRPMRAQFSAQSTWIPASGVGGGANALTLDVGNIIQLNDILGVPIRFLPTNINAAGATTINPTGLGAIVVKRASAGALVPIAGGDLTTGTMAEVLYDGTQFVQINPATGTAPVGSEVHVLAGTAAIAGYLVENGTCVSQTTFSALFAFFGNTDVWSPGSTGGACSAGNFHLPFANGRNAVAVDTQGGVTANVLTSAGSGCAATTVAVPCGAQNHALVQANLPNVSFIIAAGQGSHNHTVTANNGTTSSFSAGGNPNGTNNPSLLTTNSSTLPQMTAASGGSGTALAVQNPSYTVLKQIKY